MEIYSRDHSTPRGGASFDASLTLPPRREREEQATASAALGRHEESEHPS